MEPDQAFLEYVIKALVDHPDEVIITRSMDAMGVFLVLTVHPDDMGKIIGRNGKFATETIRPLMHAFGRKHSATVSVKINEPVGGKRDNERTEKTVDQVVDELGS